MGWQNNDGTHEGYLVGIVADNAHGTDVGPLRRGDRGVETTDRMPDHIVRAPGDRVDLVYVKVACSCGWRSPLIRAGADTYWQPNTVEAPAEFREKAYAVWRQHELETPIVPEMGIAIVRLKARS
jgi:hypothetical protein